MCTFILHSLYIVFYYVLPGACCMYKLVPLTSTLTKKFQKDLNLCENKDKEKTKDKILKKQIPQFRPEQQFSFPDILSQNQI